MKNSMCYHNATSYSVLNFSAIYSTFISFLEYLFYYSREFHEIACIPARFINKFFVD